MAAIGIFFLIIVGVVLLITVPWDRVIDGCMGIVFFAVGVGLVIGGIWLFKTYGLGIGLGPINPLDPTPPPAFIGALGLILILIGIGIGAVPFIRD